MLKEGWMGGWASRHQYSIPTPNSREESILLRCLGAQPSWEPSTSAMSQAGLLEGPRAPMYSCEL